MKIGELVDEGEAEVMERERLGGIIMVMRQDE